MVISYAVKDVLVRTSTITSRCFPFHLRYLICLIFDNEIDFSISCCFCDMEIEEDGIRSDSLNGNYQ